MNGLTAISAVFTLVALLSFGRSIRQIRRRRLLRASGAVTVGAVTAVLGTAGIMLTVSYLGTSASLASNLSP